ncbi:MAG: NUDIX hydrolase [Solirubrobacterales bacterium]
MDRANDTRAALLALARSHRPFDDVERAHQMAIIDWLSLASSALAGQDPFDRNVFEPGHATGSCMVLGRDGRAALIFHKNLKLWVQPGGHADAGETEPGVVAAREATEELGVDVSASAVELFDLDVHRIAARGDVPAHTHFDFRYLAVIEPVDLAPSTDAAEARWLTRSEIAAIGVDAGVRRMADKAVARGLLQPTVTTL